MRFLKNTFNFMRSCAFTQKSKVLRVKNVKKQNLTHPKAAKLATLAPNMYGFLRITDEQWRSEGVFITLLTATTLLIVTNYCAK